jgi:hypothetical protein
METRRRREFCERFTSGAVQRRYISQEVLQNTLAGRVEIDQMKIRKISNDTGACSTHIFSTDKAGSDEHIEPLRLLAIAQESGPLPPNDAEREHLRQCEECQHLLEVFARQFTQPGRGPKDMPEDAAQRRQIEK